MPKSALIKNPCRSCERETNHIIVHTESLDAENPEDYPEDSRYQIVKCQGCNSFSFRIQTLDYANPENNGDGTFSPSEYIETYPRFVKTRLQFSLFTPVPETIQAIYTETITAAKEQAFTLAGIGFRAIIEAICKDQKIEERDLQKKISALNEKGLISRQEAKRLHAIRFLGNDAAHEMKRPSADSIDVVLKVTEHLIENIYTLDEETQNNLETIIEDYDGFKVALLKSIKSIPFDDEKPLSAILGKTIRRLATSLLDLEKQLISEISSGNFKLLQLGKTVSLKDGKHETQYYKRPNPIPTTTSSQKKAPSRR
ncbi:DUF4145 domain-containing protein [Corallococcus sp. AB050B]|nr:DUF4145 domain-containing protein [Corallococcus sp. AB050B]